MGVRELATSGAKLRQAASNRGVVLNETYVVGMLRRKQLSGGHSLGI